ncbi:hypothetical protein BU16DRAFT_520954 [Lophium mytilinum]|uniref:Uncharacterized protein n=1 Tax=Lophium mytilinum TaxID=390894 RepID=A0A6A6RBH6_9PEZI|nr:hypothetical protein BU16DRAFT_520954 [Lophium mytilinum]
MSTQSPPSLSFVLIFSQLAKPIPNTPSKRGENDVNARTRETITEPEHHYPTLHSLKAPRAVARSKKSQRNHFHAI